MFAFDRDGTVIGKLGDSLQNHPKHLAQPEDQRLIQPVADYINQYGGIIISNQAGVANKYTSLDKVIAEFNYLHNSLPGLKASFFCPDYGDTCYMVYPQGDLIEAFQISAAPYYCHLQGTFRKPDLGMFKIAADRFGALDGYVGDLSGRPDYGNGMDSDKQAAINFGISYYDVNDFIQAISGKAII